MENQNNNIPDKIKHEKWVRKDRIRVIQAVKFARRVWLSPVNMPDLVLLNPVGRWS